MSWSKSNRETIFLRDPILWDEFTSYFFGYFLGDGCITKRGQLYLVSKDYDIISKINGILSNNSLVIHSRKPSNGCEQYRLIFTSKIWLDFFTSLGIVPNKSNVPISIEVPDLPYLYHFVRGLFDSDGCVSVGKRIQVDICGGSYIQDLFLCYNIGKLYRRKSLYVWRIIKQDELVRFYYLIYKDSSIFLKRKYLRYSDVMSKYGIIH